METDYGQINFKCGIEIHQQLDAHKLFCSCPSIIRDDKPDIVIKRRLRASAGEIGDIDKAALHESKRAKQFIYEAYSDTTCLVELDEEPPHDLNMEALEITLQIALMLNAKPVDKICFMRKTVIDGSNTSGFQRTALIATDGFVETSKGKVKIDTICLEEEAAKIVKRGEKQDTYNLSRLGIPLIEIATAPDIKNPEHCKETAEKIGMTLRSTGKVKRGLGTIRQDVNLSVKNKARVEIKGFQDLRNMPKIIENEVKRHLKLIEKKEQLKKEVRKANKDLTTSFMRPMPGAARMYPETDVKTIKPDISKIKIPELITEKSKNLEKEFNLNKDLADLIIKSNKTEIFTKLANKYKNIKPLFIADILINSEKEIKTRYKKEIDSTKHIEEILYYLEKQTIPKEAVFEILVEIAHGKRPDYLKYMSMDEKEIKKVLKEIVEKNKGAPFNALMGEAMAKLRGKADGKKIVELLKEQIK
ncbi:MAG: Glu-tRNA(Gln) amidotransferase subunit GatE [Candidatus Nanoarchaeia archaeon]|nr:Glu-tRNA(Gln) amidotransferase subunit GatE [Candidatus Nanoarchaeia archaeon]